MPVYNLFYTDVNGKPDPVALQAVGPILNVQIEIPTTLASHLQKQGQAAPTPVPGFALVDTGASSTCAEETVLTGLGINPVGVIQISTPGGMSNRSVYPARFAFPGTPIPPIDFVGIIGVDLRAQAIQGHGPMVALIGRDLLSRFILNYNGPGGMFSLSF